MALTRTGITFRYPPTGPEGLLTGKKVCVAITSGGIYSEGPQQPYDFAAPYLRWMLGFLGMSPSGDSGLVQAGFE